MRDPDIVADIDAWLEHNSLANPYRQMVSRARDEIVALRKERDGIARRVHTGGALFTADFVAAARAEALEQAARVADGYCTARTDRVAADIRALAAPPEPSDND